MFLIRNLGDISTICSLSLSVELASLVHPYAAALEEFDDLTAVIVIAEACDTLAQAEQALGKRLVADSKFTFPVEIAVAHNEWIEIVWIESDDGAGLVLLVNQMSDPQLLAACRSALALIGGVP